MIRSRGLRATPARINVLDVLLTTSTPLSHADVMERLVAREDHRATIFRNLATLAAVHLVRRVDVGDHVWRFVQDGVRWHRDLGQ